MLFILSSSISITLVLIIYFITDLNNVMIINSSWKSIVNSFFDKISLNKRFINMNKPLYKYSLFSFNFFLNLLNLPMKLFIEFSSSISFV